MSERMTREEALAELRLMRGVVRVGGKSERALSRAIAALEAAPTCACEGAKVIAEVEVDGPRLLLLEPADVQAYFATKGLPERYRLIVLPARGEAAPR